MKIQTPTELPFGYDADTKFTLTPTNDIMITHPVMPPMVFDTTVMRWVEINLEAK